MRELYKEAYHSQEIAVQFKHHHEFSKQQPGNGCMLFETCDLCIAWRNHIDGLAQDYSNSSALAMELLQSCTKPSTST